jgi:hypothetical protein
MTANTFFKHSKFKTLTDQIKDAERKVLNHRQGLKVNTAQFIGHIRRQMTAPTTLLLAGGVGFILAEVTKRQNGTAQISPLTTALNLMISAHALYTAVLLAWLRIFAPTQPKP